MKRSNMLQPLSAVMILALCAAIPISAGKPSGDVRSAADSGNTFAIDLYRYFSEDEQGENIFFSPASIHTALTMTYAGARAETAKEMREVLRLKLSDDVLHAAMGELANMLGSKREGCRLSIANALWGQDGYPFLEPFLALNREHYGAGLRKVNFVGATEQARVTINRWVEGETNDKIKDLIPKGVLTWETRLVLTNAIYFKGTWKTRFDPEQTGEAPFHVTPAKTVRADMMRLRNARFRYLHDEGVKVLEMPYEGEDISMVLLLPDQGLSLDSLEERLEADTLDNWLSRMHERKIDEVSVPKFTMTRDYGLNKVLTELGMPRAFTAGAADFSGMTGNRDLYISAVIHKAFVDVNEEGTEAAAATAVVMTFTSVREPTVFRADRPFMFLIRDKRTGAILFMGRVVDPTA